MERTDLDAMLARLEAASAPEIDEDEWPYNLIADLFGKQKLFHVRLDLLDDTIARLPRHDRLVLRLSYQAKRPAPWIAYVLGCSEKTVKTTLDRTKRTLCRPPFRGKLLSVPQERHTEILARSERQAQLLAQYRARLARLMPGTGLPPSHEAPIVLDDLDLPAHPRNCLDRAGLLTVEQITAKSASELLAIRTLGPGALKDIRRALSAVGLSLAGERPDGKDR